MIIAYLRRCRPRAVRACGNEGAGLFPAAQGHEGVGSLHELCERRHRFEVDNILHEYVSQHEQRHAGRTTRALLLQRTLPRLWLDAHAVRGMVGLWRDCVVVCGEAVEPALLVAFMCAGAKAVVAPALDSRGASLLDEVRVSLPHTVPNDFQPCGPVVTGGFGPYIALGRSGTRSSPRSTRACSPRTRSSPAATGAVQRRR